MTLIKEKDFNEPQRRGVNVVDFSFYEERNYALKVNICFIIILYAK